MDTHGFDTHSHNDVGHLTVDRFEQALRSEPDFVSDGLLENINSTPLGRLLKIIAHLPEIRQEKVVQVKRQLDHDLYDIGEHLDLAMDKMLEEFIAEG